MNIQKLRTNHLENPLGYLLDTLSLSWVVTGKYEPGMETKVLVAADATFEDVLFESDVVKRSQRVGLPTGDQLAAANALLLESHCSSRR